MIMQEPVARLWPDYRCISMQGNRNILANKFQTLVQNTLDWWNKCVEVGLNVV